MVKPKRIEKIVLKNFRGATGTTELMLEADKPMVLIFGENGTGKSTILDAIDLVCNKSIGSIGERSSTDAKKHLPSLGSQPEDIRVELTYNGEIWTGTLSGKNINVKGSDPLPKAHVLRRSQLLRLVEATPGERYNELRSFIDVSQIEQCEQVLKNAEKSANKQLKDQINAKLLEEKGLEDWWSAEGKPGASALAWAKTKAQADPEELGRAVGESWRITELYDAARLAYENYERASEGLRRASERAVGVRESSRQSKGSKANIELIRLLQEAQKYLASRENDETCPVCLQSAERAELAREIKARIDAMTDSKKLDEEYRQAVKEETAARTIVEQRAGDFIGAARTLVVEARASSLEILSALGDGLSADGDALSAARGASSDEALRAATEVLAALKGARNDLEVFAAQKETDLNQLNGIRGHCERIEEADRQVAELYEVHARLKQAVELLRTERHLFTLGVLEKVRDECNRLYQSIHPEEPLGLSGFRLDEKSKGSLHQDAHFLGTDDVAPQAYFSEAHLDTLGFCLFLSIAKLASGGDAVIVLDDVFTSVDAKHLRRIVDVLTEESENFNQVVISTHNRHWLNRHRYNQAPKDKTCLVELHHHWTHKHGIRHHRSKLSVEELAEKLASSPFDRQGVASLAGVLLEATLDHLTLLYRCGLPRTQDGTYTLGDLAKGVSKLSKELKVRRLARDERGKAKKPEEVEEELVPKALLVKIADMSFIRNQVGAHFNASGDDITDDDVEELGNCTVELMSMLVCQSCGDMARKEKGTHFRCGCGLTQMVPLKLQ